MEEAGLREAAVRIQRACLAAADPAAAVRAAVRVAKGTRGNNLQINEEEIPVSGRLILAAAGKAALGMAGAALALLPERFSSGLIVPPHGYGTILPHHPPMMRILPARHPVPDGDSVDAARAMMELFVALGPDDVCLFLLSGGASSLLCLPQSPLGLEDKTRTTDLLLKSGADIGSFNIVRKHLSAIKGGRLAEAARGTIVSLVISDVVGDDLSLIASGPTVGDPSTFADAVGVLRRFDLLSKVPIAVRRHLEDGMAGKIPETPKKLPARHRAAVVCSNLSALTAAAREAEACGFTARIMTAPLTGEARDAGKTLVAAARALDASRGPVCLIAGGETTVTVTGTGRGGRNQELALSAALELEGAGNILLASFATDGVDGAGTAAGAMVTGGTAARIRARGLDPRALLENNDSQTALAAAGDLLITGPTHTNVNDVCIVLAPNV